MSRRSLLRAGAAGALMAAAPSAALAGPLGPRPGISTSRESRLGRRTRLVHADLHNHSQHSDGAGDPARAYQSMRDAGLDAAALTDHTVAAKALGPLDPCAVVPDPDPGDRDPCRSLLGMNQEGFEATARYAAVADAPGTFAAIRGFEWSSPFLGHVNVWSTSEWIDPLLTAGLTASGLAEVGVSLSDLEALLGPLPGGEQILALIREAEPAGMRRFYDWLQRAPGNVLGGGGDGIAGFNHPNREPGVFDAFAFDRRVREAMVSMEIMNRREDYLFKHYDEGFPSPLVACLDAGWRVGLLGVTDEHGTDWGEPDGKGRAGLWVDDLDRDGILDAMRGRRMFATNVRGLRLDAAANGNTRMGATVPGRPSRLRFELDLDWGEQRAGTPVEIQVLTSGDDVPTVVHVEEVRLPAPSSRRPIRFQAPSARDRTSWVVLRIADPSRPNETPGPDGHPANNRALAYSSPFHLAGSRPRRSGGPRGGGAPTLPPLTDPTAALGGH